VCVLAKVAAITFVSRSPLRLFAKLELRRQGCLFGPAGRPAGPAAAERTNGLPDGRTDRPADERTSERTDRQKRPHNKRTSCSLGISPAGGRHSWVWARSRNYRPTWIWRPSEKLHKFHLENNESEARPRRRPASTGQQRDGLGADAGWRRRWPARGAARRRAGV
jgi:hypothetical protein